jgi:hypothetical protein
MPLFLWSIIGQQLLLFGRQPALYSARWAPSQDQQVCRSGEHDPVGSVDKPESVDGAMGTSTGNKGMTKPQKPVKWVKEMYSVADITF